MAGIRAINTAATLKYVSREDEGFDESGNHSEGATVWEIGALDSYVQSYVSSKSTSYTLKPGADPNAISEDDVQENVDIHVDIYGMALDTCRFCLRGWSNFKDYEGNDIEFKTKKTMIKDRAYWAMDSDLLAMIPKDVIMELYGKINEISNVSVEQEKNSATG